jgi:hypothetical protein
MTSFRYRRGQEVAVFDYTSRMFHVGHLVHDIDAAMSELGSSLGLTWTHVVSREDQRVWTPQHGQRRVPLKFCYSTEGPQRVELLEGAPDTPWSAADVANLHHFGVWADVPALTESLLNDGWELVCSQVSPAEGYGSFTYVRSPSGFLLEPVAEANEERMNRWFAGGELI